MTSKSASGCAVLFDVDGTLLDTVPLIVESYQYAFQTVLGRPGDSEAIKASIGMPLESFFGQFPPVQAEAILRTYLDYNKRRLGTGVAIFLGVFQLLRQLRLMGIPLAIVTSKRYESVMPSLRDFGMDGFFQVLVTKESTPLHKPNPQPVQEALRQLQITDPSRAIFVGDSLHDLSSARQAGCRVAIVAWTAMPVGELLAASPDIWLEKPGQLIDYLAARLDCCTNIPG